MEQHVRRIRASELLSSIYATTIGKVHPVDSGNSRRTSGDGRRWLTGATVALVLVVSTLAGALGLQAAPAGATASGWQVSASFAPQLTPGTAGGVDCPSATVCFAIGNSPLSVWSAGAIIAGSTDGGSTWHALSVPAAVGQLTALSCPTTTTCYAIGSDQTGNSLAIETTDSGSTWVTLTLPSGDTPFGISCPIVSTCFVPATVPGGYTVLHTGNSGGIWTAQTVPVATTGVGPIACSSSSSCATRRYTSAGVGIMVTTDGGLTWTSASTPSTLVFIDGFSCVATTNSCFAVGDENPGGGAPLVPVVLVSASSLTTWNAQGVPAGINSLYAISCASALVCEASGQGLGGPGPGGSGGIIGTTDGGTIWSLQTIPATTTGLAGVSCATTSICVATGSDFALPTSGGVVLTTGNGGTNWTTGTLPGTGNVNTLSCPTTANCMAIAGNQVLATADRGTTWTHQSVPSSTPYYLQSLSCATATTCVIVGTSAWYTTNAGATWTQGSLPDTGGPGYRVLPGRGGVPQRHRLRGVRIGEQRR